MITPTEYSLVERPILDHLASNGYTVIHPSKHPTLRARENEVLFKPLLIDALIRINAIPAAEAEAIYQDLAGLTDNSKWIEILRGSYSRKLSGEDTHRTIRLIDFDTLHNNHFAVTSQLRVLGEVVRKPDVVVYVNGVPLVVIEAKSPINPSQNTFDAIDQIRGMEREVPRLFHSNLFNVATNDLTLMYGATGSPREHWARWRDPWPRDASEFSDETSKGLFSLLDRSRLLDILAHFIVFETRGGATIKKLCRYQQLRAVNKMVDRVVAGQHRAGLIWHTQGSGKSLTMVMAALKLKFHRGLRSPALTNPNLLIITDRIDLHNQLAATFQACGLPNPIAIQSIQQLKDVVVAGVSGRTVLATIFQFHWDDPRFRSASLKEREQALKDLRLPDSERWILMVDEAHRTQDQDLGAFLAAILPDAVRFGFTGTPVKKGDVNTYTTFGVEGETYLDRYSIDDAVADGATVPIYYQGRLTQWHLHDKEIDVLFDQWFANEPEERIDELKKRGVTKGDLARFAPRIALIAVDIWAHFRAHVAPDGFKAQICAIDRAACVAYKLALDAVITASLMKTEKLPEGVARARASAMSVCVYSPGQHDAEQHPELVEHQIPPEDVTPLIVPRFLDPADPLCFIIVCNKLLTGFDAPIEQAMYLDNPLTDHSLLQAIARTNRRYGSAKQHGLIVDYIGVSRRLTDALESYRKEDVANAMRDVEVLHDQLRAAHREVMALIAGVPRTEDVRADIDVALEHLRTLDRWFVFRSKADAFLAAYSALSPDARVLPYLIDLKFIGAILPYGRLKFEQVEQVDWKKYSEKIRAMLDEHLEVTGLKMACKLRSLSDPDAWKKPEDPGELKSAAVRKLAELKRETTERSARNPRRYERFSDRIKALIKEFSAGLIDADKLWDASEALRNEVLAEDQAHAGSGLSERAYGLAVLLETFRETATVEEGGTSYDGGAPGLSAVQRAAVEIDRLYGSDQQAPLYWQDKAELKKGLRGQVRRLIQDLGLSGWQGQVPLEVEHFAVIHYARL